MRHTWGVGVFVAIVLCAAGLAIAQGSTQSDKRVDQPIQKAGEGETVEEEETEEPLLDPPPFYGEQPAPGERQKIVFCIDRSGSMAGPGGSFVGPGGEPTSGSKWDRAVAETTISLSLLTPEWEFGVVVFNSGHELFRPELIPAEPENVEVAIAWIASKQPYGMTGTGPAQAAAFRLADGGTEGSATCWLVSDGAPNVGASGTAGHKAVALAANTQDHVLNTIGIADSGIFAAFMKELAAATGGKYFHVQ
jgi:hypothetical protein